METGRFLRMIESCSYLWSHMDAMSGYRIPSRLCLFRLLGRRIVVFWTHRREEQHLLKMSSSLSAHSYRTPYFDVVGVREDHGEAIDAHSPSGRRGQSVLESIAERLVDTLSLVVSSIL